MNAKYYIYRNLHKNCYSVRYKGKVIDHFHSGVLKNVKFKVNESGRKRVLKTGQKNVHAFIVVDSYEHTKVELKHLKSKRFISYNPFKNSTFVTYTSYNREHREPIHEASEIVLIEGIVAIWN